MVAKKGNHVVAVESLKVCGPWAFGVPGSRARKRVFVSVKEYGCKDRGRLTGDGFHVDSVAFN